ncbi:hypothetical protein [Maribacter sp. Asnod1-A12]|uniref:hypothetical protein n=1 Tax=Maribacter sp. Asnod1-A12 TaxID=3160576 RepID=UPI00386CC019
MKVPIIKSSELKEITSFLIEKKIIFHPTISPNGTPDFSSYNDKRYILILDRNLLVRILRLANTGTLKEKFSLKLINSLLAWAEFNGITATAGMALMEYSYHNQGDKESNIENNVFLEIFKKTNLYDWINLAMGKKNTIPSINSNNDNKNDFFVKSDHFKMHYLEMLKMTQLYFDDNVSIENKFKLLLVWIYDNILICKYTIFYSLLVFGNKSKIFKNQIYDYQKLIKICSNQAWDLTYLSIWSTLYFNESESKDIFLLATMDKELKDLFVITHKDNLEIFIDTFGSKLGNNIIENINEILVKREKPEIDSKVLDKLILNEEKKLRHLTQPKRNAD